MKVLADIKNDEKETDMSRDNFLQVPISFFWCYHATNLALLMGMPDFATELMSSSKFGRLDALIVFEDIEQDIEVSSLMRYDGVLIKCLLFNGEKMDH